MSPVVRTLDKGPLGDVKQRMFRAPLFHMDVLWLGPCDSCGLFFVAWFSKLLGSVSLSAISWVPFGLTFNLGTWEFS